MAKYELKNKQKDYLHYAHSQTKREYSKPWCTTYEQGMVGSHITSSIIGASNLSQ